MGERLCPSKPTEHLLRRHDVQPCYLRHLFHAQELWLRRLPPSTNLILYLWLWVVLAIIAGDFFYLKPAMMETFIYPIVIVVYDHDKYETSFQLFRFYLKRNNS